jgi:hypothetical protein
MSRFSTDENGTIRGFAYHDGFLDGVALAPNQAQLHLRSSTGTKRVLTLRGVKALDVQQLREGNIVNTMRVLPAESFESNAEVKRNVSGRLFLESVPTDCVVFQLDCSYGADVIAICHEVVISDPD